ncbi:MAG: TIGR04053 family radical SAM/SPASM domain-containing protein [Chloroflexi bacterium]|nr:TIGR04053 family radical SAM/SPASM domain-containing protein [Chloroflexota bacterium]
MNYKEKPLLIYWELTRACDLACKHCRAKAVPWRHPQELTNEEGHALLEQLASFEKPLPHLVFTGGDPLKRSDLFDLIAYARDLGFTVSVTPSGTPLLTEEMILSLQQAGIWMMALSLDGSTPHSHDTIRGVPGSFDRTLQAARWAKATGLPLQVNTLVCDQTLDELPDIFTQLTDIGITQWALFFLIPVGRGAILKAVTPEESEDVMRWTYETAQHSPFRIRTTEAPHYRRFVLQQATSERKDGSRASDTRSARSGFGVRDGNGIMFISHTGAVYPSGFLPLAAGHVRRHNPVEIYRSAPLFCVLREPDGLKGKCGFCEYRQICGGSRARAYAATGDPMESDPLCPYEPSRQRVAIADQEVRDG